MKFDRLESFYFLPDISLLARLISGDEGKIKVISAISPLSPKVYENYEVNLMAAAE